MRMKRKTGLVIRRICRLKMIEKQKGIEIVKRMAADAPLQSNARALDDICGSIILAIFLVDDVILYLQGVGSSSSAENLHTTAKND